MCYWHGEICPFTAITCNNILHIPFHPSALLMPYPDETPRKCSYHRNRARRLVYKTDQCSSAAGAGGRGGCCLQAPCRRFREMACIVLNQDNKALPQPLSYGNPDRLLSSPSTRGSVAPWG